MYLKHSDQRQGESDGWRVSEGAWRAGEGGLDDCTATEIELPASIFPAQTTVASDIIMGAARLPSSLSKLNRSGVGQIDPSAPPCGLPALST